MRADRHALRIFLVCLSLLLSLLACGTGYATSSSSFGDRGKVAVRADSADGDDR